MMLSAEIAALRRIGLASDFDGRRIAYAYGCDLDGLLQDTACYDFEMMFDGAELACTIDVYSALRSQNGSPGEFDVDAWEAAKIHLRGAPTRENYRALQSTARAVLKGYRVVLPGGKSIHVPALYATSPAVKS